MKRCAALLLLAPLLVPLLAQAATWRKVAGSKDGAVYVDKASIKRGDDGRRAWTLASFKQPQTAPDGRQYLSVKALHLYDCAQRSVTLQSQEFYAAAMAKGEIVGTYKYEAFDAEQVADDHRLAGAMDAVCGKARKG